MRMWISLFFRRRQGASSQLQSAIHTNATARESGSSRTRAAFARIGALSLVLFFLSILGGIAYLLSARDWLMDDTTEMQDAGGSGPRLPQASVLGLSWSADGSAFLSRSTRVSDGESPLLLHRVTDEESAWIISATPVVTGEQIVLNAVLLPDASSAIVISESGMVVMIAITSGVRTNLLDLSKLSTARPSVAVASDGSWLAFAIDREVLLYDPRSLQEGLRLPGRSAYVADISFSENGESIAAGYADGTIRVWNRITGAIDRDLPAHSATVGGVRFVNGHRRLTSVGLPWDDTLRLWDLDTGELLWSESAGQSGLYALSVSADGARAATGGGDGQIVVWDLNEHSRLRSCPGHAGMIRALQFSRDGTTLTSASSDGTIHHRDVETMELLSSTEVGAGVRPVR